MGRDDRGRYQKFVDLNVKTVQGAQGLWCEPGKYYYVADGGLWLAIDLNGDCIADAPPKKVLTLPTGGEHDAHAIRRGPDGWWYLIVGNYAANITRLKNDGKSPVDHPRAGTIWRISPDFSIRGVWAHGLRNAYDFDFLADGSIVSYDSDEERELTLPWYRQTRVAILTAGSDAGWVDSAWNDLATRVTMPHVITQLGRGSPTGVKVYDHHAFPKKYENAVFVEDWTFGRVLAIYPQPKDVADKDSAPERFTAETFLQTSGTKGFAPTDITVAPDGSLLICSGGRGTTGTLYRVRYAGAPSNTSTAEKESYQSELLGCLSIPSPWEAWSRNKWEAIWKSMPLSIRLAAIRGEFKGTTRSNMKSSSGAEKGPTRSEKAKLQRRAIQFEIDLQNRGFFSVTEQINLSELMKLAIDLPLEKISSSTDLTSAGASQDKLPPIVRQAAWWGMGRSSGTGRKESLSPDNAKSSFRNLIENLDETRLSQCLDSNKRNTTNQLAEMDSTFGIEDLIGEPVIRAYYECLGMHQALSPSVKIWKAHQKFIPYEKPRDNKDTASADNTTSLPRNAVSVRTAEAHRTVRQIQLWAAYRASQPSSASRTFTSEELAFDTAFAKRLYGAKMLGIDAVLMDHLARRASQRQIPSTVPDVLEALVVLQTALGDYRHAIPSHQPPTVIEAFDGYKSMFGAQVPDPIRDGWAKWCMIVANVKAAPRNGQGNTPSQQSNGSQVNEIGAWNAMVVPEAIRTLAMLAPKSPDVVSFCLERITPNSHPTADIHTLLALASCSAPRSSAQTIATADALTGVVSKVRDLALNTESRWTSRLQEIWKRLVMQDTKLQTEFVNRPSFGNVSDLFWLRFCPEQIQSIGRNRYKLGMLRISPENWDQEITRFVWEDPKTADSSIKTYLRSSVAKQNTSPSSLILELLSQSPVQSDYPFFLEAIESSQRDFQVSGWVGLSKLNIENPSRELVTLTSVWNRVQHSEIAGITPRALSIRLRNAAKQQGATNAPSSESWSDWQLFLKKLLGEQYPKLVTKTELLPGKWVDRINTMNSKAGNSERGRLIYQQAKCASCHGGGNANSSNALGPSLTGVTKRFSTHDLFQAIFEPGKDISDRYRSTKVLTQDGNIIVGMKIYESVEGVTLQLADGTVARINQADIEEKGISDQSLMPAGLLDERDDQDLADLYSYLKSL